MNRSLRKHIASLFILAVFGLLGIACLDTETDTERVQSQTAIYTLSANELYSEYEKNEVAANAKYKGKVVLVSGTIQDIGKDVMDQAYIIVGSRVQCFFTGSWRSYLAGLSKGQRVTVKGEVTGMTMGYVLIKKSGMQYTLPDK